MADAKGSRKIADPTIKLSEVMAAFELAVAVWNEKLTTVQDAALHHKAACEKKYDALLTDVENLLANLEAMMKELTPTLQGLAQLAKQRTASAQPAQRPAKKAPQARKEGV